MLHKSLDRLEVFLSPLRIWIWRLTFAIAAGSAVLVGVRLIPPLSPGLRLLLPLAAAVAGFASPKLGVFAGVAAFVGPVYFASREAGQPLIFAGLAVGLILAMTGPQGFGQPGHWLLAFLSPVLASMGLSAAVPVLAGLAWRPLMSSVVAGLAAALTGIAAILQGRYFWGGLFGPTVNPLREPAAWAAALAENAGTYNPMAAGTNFVADTAQISQVILWVVTAALVSLVYRPDRRNTAISAGALGAVLLSLGYLLIPRFVAVLPGVGLSAFAAVYYSFTGAAVATIPFVLLRRADGPLVMEGDPGAATRRGRADRARVERPILEGGGASPASPELKICPECGARNVSRTVCWQCGAPLASAAADQEEKKMTGDDIKIELD